MESKFKEGDLVFELDFYGGIRLEVLKKKSHQDGDFHELTTRYGYNYSQCGRAYPNFKVPHLIHANQEMREKLVTIWGEDVVPKLPLSPQEATKKLLENQKFQLCKVSNHNNAEWNFNSVLKAVVHIGVFGEFIDSNGAEWTYGIPIDNNGNEIVRFVEDN